MKVIRVVAALITDPEGRMLVVRKRGTSVFMNPGGKPEVGESDAQALRRELTEEIGLDVSEDDLRPVGFFIAPAANEPDHDIHAEVFRLHLVDAEHRVGAEIAESRWISPHVPGDTPLAPLAVDELIPLLVTSDVEP